MKKVNGLIRLAGTVCERLGIKKHVLVIVYKVRKGIQYVIYFLNKSGGNWRVWETPDMHIMSIDDTIDYILEKKLSICRFGDGELNLIDKESIGFQNVDFALSDRLKEVIGRPHDEVLVCVPGVLKNVEQYTLETRVFWVNLLAKKREKWRHYLDDSYTYGNADITRCYIGLRDKSASKRYFSKLKKLWENKRILLVEGEKSRLGVGNDLFSNAQQVRRILCPAYNAFSIYDRIIKEVQNSWSNDEIVLIALGPTATVLAYDLAKMGYYALDIGNIDNEYEWFLARAKKKIRNPLKFSMEVEGGAETEECMDEEYRNQIITHIF